MRPIADSGVVGLIPAWPQTFLEMDHELFSTIIHLLLLISDGLLSVSRESISTGYNSSNRLALVKCG